MALSISSSEWADLKSRTDSGPVAVGPPIGNASRFSPESIATYSPGHDGEVIHRATDQVHECRGIYANASDEAEWPGGAREDHMAHVHFKEVMEESHAGDLQANDLSPGRSRCLFVARRHEPCIPTDGRRPPMVITKTIFHPTSPRIVGAHS